MKRGRITQCGIGVSTVLAILMLVGACAENVSEPTAPPLPYGITAKISPNIDLDQTDLLLHYMNTNGVVVDVIPPWGSATSTTASDNIRFDHSTADGWVVVYNTFDVTQTNSRPVLILYNKYRGILRWWWWNDKDPAGPSNYLTYALMIDGQNTSSLNFNREFARDYSVRDAHPFVVKTNTASFNQGLLNGAWYYFDTEFAYDPNITGQPQINYSLALNAWATSVSKVKLSGDINGTINGTITGTGKGTSLVGNLFAPISTTNYENGVVRMDNGAKAQTSLGNKINSAVSSGLATALQSELSKLATQGLSILASPLSKVFNSILSSNPSPQQKVDLKLAARIAVSGDITTDQPAFFFKGAIPGTARGDLSGYLPYYNGTLGVFNLAAPPIVRWRVITGLQPPPTNGQKDVQYMIVDAPNVVFNPAVTGEFTISSITTSLIYIKSYSGQEPLSNSNFLANTNFTSWAVINNVYGNVWYGFSAPYAIRYNLWSGTPEQNIVEMISFSIIPKNGAPPVEVTKIYKPTFLPF